VTSYNYDSVTSAFYPVDTGSDATSFTTMAGLITSFGLTSSNITTYNSNAIYTFLLDSEHNIPANGYV
jgi:hypothetical protein